MQLGFAQDQDTLPGYSVTGDTAWYHNHELIAILPFRAIAPGMRKYGKGMTREQVIKEETVFGMQVQQAFYNSVTNDEERWKVSVQDCRVTDSLLEKAGIDLHRATFMDKRWLAAILKVDAVIIGHLENFVAPGVGSSSSGKLRAVYMALYDGRTGDHLWAFRMGMRPEAIIGNFYRLNPDLYNAFRKSCPYTSGKTYHIKHHL